MEKNKNDGVSTTGGIQKSSTPNLRTERLKKIYKCVKCMVHASQCKVAGCKLPSCNRMKKILQHTKTCKRPFPGGCLLCKQLIALCIYHAKDCKEAVCHLPYCIKIKEKLEQQQSHKKLPTPAQDLKSYIIAVQNRRIFQNILQLKAKHSKSSTKISSAGQPCSTTEEQDSSLAAAQDLKNRFIAMQKRRIFQNILQQKAKHSKSSNKISSAGQSHSALHSPPFDPTSSSGPPTGVLLAVKEMQDAAARQAAQAPKAHMMSDIPDY